MFLIVKDKGKKWLYPIFITERIIVQGKQQILANSQGYVL
jgi:hypothetical protein